MKFPSLRCRDDLFGLLREEFCRLPKVIRADVRSCSGSVIIEHPDGPISVLEVQALVARALAVQKAPRDKSSATEVSALSCTISDRNNERKSHVSGPMLLLSGLYVLCLFARNVLRASIVTATAIPTTIFTLPALVVFALSLPIQRQALKNLKQSGKPDMGLISTGLLYLAIFTGNVLAALTVFWLFNLSSWLEDRIRVRTRRAVRAMLNGRVTSAWLVRDDGIEIEVAVDSLQPGDVISIRLGNVIPVDGTVIEGQSLVNEATLTGESMPVAKDKGTSVLAGTTVEEGHLLVRVDKAGEKTRLAAIIRLIETAENDPGELQLTSRRFSEAMVPVSLGLAAVAFFVTGNLIQAVAVLIITCPCALRLSTSVAVSSAMSRAAGQGILIKGGRYIEIAGQVNVLVLDKTGTITHAASEVTDIIVLNRRYSQENILQLAASVQKTWPHPMSRAVLEQAKEQGVSLLPCERSTLITGRGVRAMFKKREVLVGSRKFMEEQQVDCSLEIMEKEGSSEKLEAGLLYIAAYGNLIGLIRTRSRIREDLQASLQHLRTLGVRHIVLLTGDNEAGTVGLRKQFGFDEVHSSQSPEDKIAWISDWKTAHPADIVAMVGDGINDTPAFAAADLSLAMEGGGADVTVEYADIVLHPGAVAQVGATLEIGSRSLATIQESYTLAVSLNAATLAATTLGIISPVAGALLHNLITVAAVANAANLRCSGEQPVIASKKNRLV